MADKAKKAPARRARKTQSSRASGPATRQERRRAAGPSADKAELTILPEYVRAHNELIINLTDLYPDRDFELEITGPGPAFTASLRSDPAGQAQLIWRTGVGGEYKVTAKGPGIDLKGGFTVSSYDPDADWRAEKRAKAKGKGTPKSADEPKPKPKAASKAKTKKAPEAAEPAPVPVEEKPADETPTPAEEPAEAQAADEAEKE